MKALTDRGRAAIAAGTTLAVAGWALGFPDLTRLGLAGVAVVLVAAATVIRRRSDVTVRRVGPTGRLVAGEPTSLAVHVAPSASRSPALLVEQPLPAATGPSPHAWVPPMTAPQSFTLDVTSTFPRRGMFTLPPCILTREDPFGFARRSWPVGAASTVVVLPRIHDLSATPRQIRGSGDDGHLPILSGRPDPDGLGVRTYVPGDDLRRIHWPATAHRGELMTRHEEPVASTRTLIVLDPSLADPGRRRALEWSIELAASVAAAWERLGVTCELATWAPPHDHRAVLSPDDLLHDLAVLQTRRRTHAWLGGPDEETRHLATRITAAGTVLLLGATDGGGATGDLLRALPAGAGGFACLVGGVAGPGVADLADLARSLGWAVTVTDPATRHADVWDRLIGEGAR